MDRDLHVGRTQTAGRDTPIKPSALDDTIRTVIIGQSNNARLRCSDGARTRETRSVGQTDVQRFVLLSSLRKKLKSKFRPIVQLVVRLVVDESLPEG